MNFDMMLLIVRSGGRSLDCAAMVDGWREGARGLWGKSGEAIRCCNAQLFSSGS